MTKTLTPTEKLIRQYEPILFLDAAEQFVPVDAKRYLEHCRLWSTAALSADDAKDSWGLAPGKTFPRSPWAYAGTLVGRPEEAGYFIGNDDVKYASTHEVEFWLEMGGWRDIDGTHAGTVDTNTVNTYADSAEVARQYSDVPELDASKFWYHAEVFDAAKLRQLLGTVESPDLMRILVGLHNPTLLCYYMFFRSMSSTAQTRDAKTSRRTSWSVHAEATGPALRYCSKKPLRAANSNPPTSG